MVFSTIEIDNYVWYNYYTTWGCYGFDRINNLGAFAIAVAEELAAKKKPVPIAERKKPKVTQKVTARLKVGLLLLNKKKEEKSMKK